MMTERLFIRRTRKRKRRLHHETNVGSGFHDLPTADQTVLRTG